MGLSERDRSAVDLSVGKVRRDLYGRAEVAGVAGPKRVAVDRTSPLVDRPRVVLGSRCEAAKTTPDRPLRCRKCHRHDRMGAGQRGLDEESTSFPEVSTKLQN